MTPSAEITRTTHLTQFRGVYFGLKNQCKIVLNIVKKKIMVHDANKNIEKTQTIVLHVVIKKKQVRRGTYRESENLLRSIDIW